MNPRVLYRAAAYGDARSIADSIISALSPAAWYRNATLVTESGGFASAWGDYSGNGRDLLQATGTNQPAYANGIFTFDGVDNYMKTSAFTLVQPCTIIMVFKQITWANYDYFTDGNSASSALIFQTGSSPNFAVYAGTSGPATTSLALNTYGIIAATYNGASSELRLNMDAASTGNAGASNPGGFALGGQSSGGQNSHIAVKEIIVGPSGSAITGSTLDSVITALNNALTVF